MAIVNTAVVIFKPIDNVIFSNILNGLSFLAASGSYAQMLKYKKKAIELHVGVSSESKKPLMGADKACSDRLESEARSWAYYDWFYCSSGLPSILVLFLDCGLIRPSEQLKYIMSGVTILSLLLNRCLLFDFLVFIT